MESLLSNTKLACKIRVVGARSVLLQSLEEVVVVKSDGTSTTITPAVQALILAECIRGLLCANCNRGLGCFKDDVSLIISAMGYLWRDFPRKAERVGSTTLSKS